MWSCLAIAAFVAPPPMNDYQFKIVKLQRDFI